MEQPAGQIEAIMEEASGALARGDYLDCETSCLEALALARQRGDWAYYGRILLPLQEARRHRRTIAADGTIRLGTSELKGLLVDWLERVSPGCIVLTHQCTVAEAMELEQAARRRRLYVEMLFADCASDAPTWRLRAVARPAVRLDVPAPPAEWRERWIGPTAPGPPASKPALRPGDWFIDASEALGQAALALVQARTPGVELIEQLESCLAVFADHEIIHQRLGQAARALAGRR